MTLGEIQILKKLITSSEEALFVSLDLVDEEPHKLGNNISVFVDFESSDFVLTDEPRRAIGFQLTKMDYIKNPDGTIRWLWPSTVKKPYFLKFYAAIGLKPKVYTFLMKVLFYLPFLRKSFIQSFYVLHKKELHITNLLDNRTGEYAVFTGTVGPNRKIVVYQENGKESSFLKIPVGEKSYDAIKKEFENAKLFQPFSKNIKIPEISLLGEVLKSSDLDIKTSKTTDLSPNSQEQILFWMNQTNKQEIILNLESYINEKPNSELMADFLLTLKEYTLEWEGRKVNFCLNHGDFTPWNTYQFNGYISAYDLEFASINLPKYYDVFHYWIQNLVMCSNLINFEIYKSIEEKWLFSKFDSDAKQHEISYKDALGTYILFVSMHYYSVYNQQKELHIQGSRLLSFLNYSMRNLSVRHKSNFRTMYLEKFTSIISKYKHALVKQFEPIITIVGQNSDIDIVIEKKDLAAILLQIPNLGVVSRKLSERSNMATLELYFNDMSFISIDFIFEFKRKALVYLDANQILECAQKKQDGLWYADLRSNTDYILNFYLLNYADVPAKYVNALKEDKSQIKELETYIEKKYGFSLSQVLVNGASKSEELRNKLLASARKMKANKGLVSKFNYYSDICYLFLKQRGTVITFSGVDGAGKTTVIDQISDLIENRFRKKVIYLRHRPSLLPILSAYIHGKEKASQISMSKLPRQGGNKNLLSSFIRFMYYYLDYVFGQFYIYIKYTKRGYDVIYDRYYYDFILDGVRSNINLGTRLPKALFVLIIRPDLNFFLYASPEVILERKKEMPSEDILELTAEYQKLFNEFGQKYFAHFESIENIELDQTIDIITKRYLSAQ